jgi:hypothetical protein
VLILVWPFRWVCASGKPEDLAKQMLLPAPFSKKWQTAPIEIQQQMQDNIQWIKGTRKTNWSLAHKPEFYMQMLKAAVKSPKLSGYCQGK